MGEENMLEFDNSDDTIENTAVSDTITDNNPNDKVDDTSNSSRDSAESTYSNVDEDGSDESCPADEVRLDEDLHNEIKQLFQQNKKQIRVGSMWLCYAALIIIFIGFIAAQLPLLFADQCHSMVGLYMCSYILQMACFSLLPFYVITVALKRPPAALGFVKLDVKKVIIYGLLFGILLYAQNLLFSFISQLILPKEWITEQAAVSLIGLAQNGVETAMVTVLLVVLAPFSEEILFRAFMYPPMKLALGRPWAIFACSFIFAVLHGNISVFLPLFFGGLGFTLIYDHYGNVYYCIVAHAVWNAISLITYFVLPA